jgi:SAM-dependent methyltransferase
MLDVIVTWRSGAAVPAIAYIVARPVAPAPMNGDAARARAGQLLAVDPRGSERRAGVLRLMEERADLVGFGLTSSLRGVGRASMAVRDAVRRVMFQVLHRQTEHNRASDELVRSHEARLEGLGATVRAQLVFQAAGDERLVELERRLARIEVSSVALARRVSRGAVGGGAVDLDYVGFAERFGGSPGAVRERVGRYVRRFEGMSDVVDVGCGRGEFLELLRGAGIGAVGVDRDEGMVARCRERGLEAVRDDALHFLRGRPGESVGGIFAAHLVEHLERGEVVELVRLAFGRLRAGGALVIEAVNPMCLATFGTFYDDFTRVGPVPPAALEWLAEACGFARVEIEYGSPVPEEHKLRPLPPSAGGEAEVEAFNRGLAAANERLFGFQEYALVAIKPG